MMRRNCLQELSVALNSLPVSSPDSCVPEISVSKESGIDPSYNSRKMYSLKKGYPMLSLTRCLKYNFITTTNLNNN